MWKITFEQQKKNIIPSPICIYKTMKKSER